MFRRTLYIAALTLAACNAETAISEDVTISNFKSGLVCPFTAHADGSLERDGFICVETDKLFITGQSRCDFDGKLYPCSWYGFQFEYVNNTKSPQKLSCVVKSEEDRVYGNPKTQSEKSVKEYEYEIEIQIGAGRFYNPQYSLFGGSNTSKSQTVCSYSDKKLFELQREFINP